MLSTLPNETPSESEQPDRVPEPIAPESNRGATETARLEFEAMPSDTDTDARKTAYIHLIVSRGFWNRKPAAKVKVDPETKPGST